MLIGSIVYYISFSVLLIGWSAGRVSLLAMAISWCLRMVPFRDNVCLGYPTQDEISPFSRLNGDWMVAEWRLNDDGKGGFQSHFSHRSVTIQSTEWQAHFSDLSVSLFLKNKIAPDADRTRDVRIKGKARWPLRHETVIIYYEYLVYM